MSALCFCQCYGNKLIFHNDEDYDDEDKGVKMATCIIMIMLSMTVSGIYCLIMYAFHMPIITFKIKLKGMASIPFVDM